MIQADHTHKKLVVNILVQSFDDNKSVNYIVKQDWKRQQRIRSLMEYAFEICLRFGKVVLSENRDACALVLLPDKKKTNITTIWLAIQLVRKCFGIANIGKVLRRERLIKQGQTKDLKYYLWFIGVEPKKQGQGVGSFLLTEIVKEAKTAQRVVCLETSAERNLSFYKNCGFEVYHTLNFGFTAYFLKA